MLEIGYIMCVCVCVCEDMCVLDTIRSALVKIGASKIFDTSASLINFISLAAIVANTGIPFTNTV